MATVATFSRRPTETRRYTSVAITLHWLIAAAVLTNLALGWLMGSAQGLNKFTLFQLHKSVGITVLALTALRVVWRLMHKPPAYPATMARWERVSAKSAHLLFYALMIVMPMTGWVIVSASALNIPTLLYGVIPLPYLGFVHDLSLAQRHSVEGGVATTHTLLAYLFAGLAALHVAAALKHRFVTRDDVLSSMVPWRSSEAEPVRMARSELA